jgi:hypothetical protein
MTMRQWSIVAILFFVNAFVFVTLFLLLRQVYLTPSEVAVVTPAPTKAPTFTPLPTYTPTSPLAPTPTSTRVVPPASPTPTFTPTFTPAPPTPTSPPPTATPVPATPTPTQTFTPTPTPTPAWEYRTANVACYHSGDKFIEGHVYEGDAPKNGVTVRLSWAPDEAGAADYVTGTESTRPGYYLHPRPKGDTGTYYVWVVDASGKRISDIGMIQFNNEGSGSPTACWRGYVDFVRNL